MTKQKDTFLLSEGNAWHARNPTHMDELQDSPDVQLIKNHVYTLAKDAKILEIGCADGARLNAYRGPLAAYGIDPSQKAIHGGKQRYGDLHLFQGSADDLPFEDAYFDMVVFGFCLYLIDRSLLLRTIAQADRVLKDNGLLVITDFDASNASVRPYHHHEGLFTFKQPYEKILTSSFLYTLIERKSYSHTANQFVRDPQERVCTCVLHKSLSLEYTPIR